MKRILLAVILGSTFVGSIPAMETTKKVLLSLAEIDGKTNLCTLAKPLGSYALMYSMAYIHELGHVATYKLLFGDACSCKIYVSPFFSVGKNNWAGYTDIKLNRDKCLNLSDESINKRIAIGALAGPIVGLAANALTLKLHDIFIEYSRNNSHTFLQACLKGLQKPLFNSDQSLYVLIPVISIMAWNISSLTNIEDNNSDISYALKRFQISNPKDSYPILSKLTKHLTRFCIGSCAGAIIGAKISKLLEKK
jgi:hypothetical protein